MLLRPLSLIQICRELLLFANPFEWSPVLLAIHKLTIGSTLGPNASLGIQNLTSLAHHSIYVAVTGRWICRHTIGLIPTPAQVFENMSIVFGWDFGFGQSFIKNYYLILQGDA